MVDNKIKFKKIALAFDYSNTKASEIAHQCEEILTNFNATLTRIDYGELSSSNSDNSTSRDQFYKKVKGFSLLIAIGGDGTILGCSRYFGYKGIPVLGINLGNLGFLTDISPKELATSLIEVLKGKFLKDTRSFLECKLGSEEKEERKIALNEVVFHSGAVAKLIEFNLYIDGRFVFRQRADGLIIGTPTGSTAYSLSGGGPIVHPAVNTISVLSMFPHSLSSSPFLIPDDSHLTLELVNKKDKAKIVLDGQNSINHKKGELIHISKAKEKLTLIHPKGHDFYEACRNKLGWSTGIEPMNNH